MKFAFSLFASSLAIAAAQDATLLETVAGNEDLSTLATAVGLAGIGDFLSNTSDLTVFAPNNDAFVSLPAKFLEPGFLLHLVYLLQYHVYADGVVLSTDLTDGQVITMANGENITAAVNDQGVFFSGAAFQNSQVIAADVLASNGVAHVVNGYFLPELLTLDLFTLASMQDGFGNVLDLIAASGLEEELKMDNRTILAPSNTAFEALPEEFLSQVATDLALQESLLRYHLIIGSYPKSLITNGLEVMTALGAPLTFSVVGGGRFAQISAAGPSNNVTVEIGDLIAANGIAHTIGGVLTPPEGATPAPVDPTPTPTEPSAPTPDGQPSPVVEPTPTTSSNAFMIGGVMAAVASVAAALF